MMYGSGNVSLIRFFPFFDVDNFVYRVKKTAFACIR